MKATIGLEIHVHLLTDSKLFCSCRTSLMGKEPNENTCPICLGFPGSKPKANKRAIDHGIVLAKALSCSLVPEIRFSRKNYFYPDMPKNFQITQYEVPLAMNGYVMLGNRKIRIRRVHLEEDPAKLIHVGGDITTARYNHIDYNRAGIPLVEIVTEPDLEDTKEARLFLEKLSVILDHLGVYDPTTEGAIRVDANVSIDGGQRVEVKNITGFRNVEKALNYEVVRQKSMANMGIDVSRETRHFDAESGTTSSLRKKETEDDYGYIIEPDLVKIKLHSEWVDKLTESMPELPDHRIERFIEQYSIGRFQAGIIVNTGLQLSLFYEECCNLYKDPKIVVNWIVTYLLKSLNYERLNIKESKVKPETFVELLKLIDEGVISERTAKELIKEYTVSGESPRKIVKEKNLSLMSEDELHKVVSEVIEENPKAVNDYQSGHVKAAEYLIGQVLRKTRARAAVDTVRKLITDMMESKPR
ncbi:MAG: Asp-tRNA(Asn)/Glu-tRNA(Gln) amidotransferase subunit GatB [Candidatus Bathyarchaeota archaeon]|nr:Asp-tRNA(Asn)/Glu-tRNA(Gln) amidotransferase subunit GatB [Candidatus Bathyarchaeota archaeon]